MLFRPRPAVGHWLLLGFGLLLLTSLPSPSTHGDEPDESPVAAPIPDATEAPAQPTAPVEPFAGLKVPEGFEVTLYADDDLAHDIYSLTIDSRGRVVVAGAGYVRILIDENGDGRADSFRQFADGPKSGAMGMFFHGPDLLCTGDAGLLRYRDRDGDDRADGPPDVFLKIKTGGEHDAHAIKRGPDGWWYLLSGNMAQVTSSYVTLPTSPVRDPEAGTLMRLKPDLTGGEIVAHGMRNAYDFDFNAQGDAFTFDSDGERDISLPWYRPTRVFQLLSGADCGWITRSWKRPDEFADMPPVLGAFGRGSPTGVACYRHTQFPESYRGALLIQDWTFGRVFALPMNAAGDVWSSEPIEFVTGRGQFGFAPTGVAVGPDGSVFISVGGRGTRGSVFRVRWTGTSEDSAEWALAATAEESDKLDFCLSAPQPLSSWSRARWTPVAGALGALEFRRAALDRERSSAQRVRAIEILTELFDGVDVAAAETFAADPAPEVRARYYWSLGRDLNSTAKLTAIERGLSDSSPFVVRVALEALITAETALDLTPLLASLARTLDSEHRFVRQTAARIVSRLSVEQLTALRTMTRDASARAAIARELGIVWNRRQPTRGGIEIGLAILEGDYPSARKLDAARLIQVSLGDVGPLQDRAPVLDGYAPRLSLEELERHLDPYRVRLSNLFPSGDDALDDELLRLIAMLEPYNLDLLDKILAGLTDESHPTDDLHRLIVASRLPLDRNFQQTEQIARALVQIDHKIRRLGLKQDSNWQDRIEEMYAGLVKHDPALPETILQQAGFGLPGHYIFLSQIEEDAIPAAIAGFLKQIEADPDYQWTNEVVFVLGESTEPAHRELLRAQYENLSVRNAVLAVLSREPLAEDRAKFVAGLGATHLVGISSSAEALSRLDRGSDPAELFALLDAIRRLSNGAEELEVRAKLMHLLQTACGEDFGFETGPEGYVPQPEPIERAGAFLARTHPEEARRQLGAASQEWERLQTLFSETASIAGDAERGRALFDKRACSRCHGGRQALGPDLAGVAKRFAPPDLLTAIALPSRDVASRYRTTLIQTDAGKVYAGIIVYESVDGVILRDAENKTYRIEDHEIEERRQLSSSLMPEGLLKDISATELADLLAYLRSLDK